MTRSAFAAALTLFAAMAAGAGAAQTALSPAAPQPDASARSPGLSVAYAYPADVRELKVAKDWLEAGKEPGPPLGGRDYMDSARGEPILTASRAEFVAAEIGGYLYFDAPGTWGLELHSNDGVELYLGGARVERFNGRRPCDTNGWTEVSVPSAGWYAVEATFFQRLHTACLMMRWRKPGGAVEWTPRDAWAFRK